MRDAEAADGPPPYLYAAPGIAWWLFWLYLAVAHRGTETAGLVGMLAVLPVLLLTCVAAVFGLFALALLRISVGQRLAVCAVNLSGPILVFATR